MKTASEIYRQHRHISARIFLVARMFAKRAHPETGGNDMLCHNWGNDESRMVWSRAYKRMDKARAIYQRMYSLAEHSQHHDAKFCPLWCEHCHPALRGGN